MNDSSTGGYLLPLDAPTPAHDLNLDQMLHQIAVSLTGLPPERVRPRWQPVVPRQLAPSVDWCAMGVTQIAPDANPAFVYSSEGAYTLIRHETITALCSCYGPRGMQMAAQLRDGLSVAQNHDELGTYRMALVSTGELLSVPEVVNQQWIKRYDLPLVLRRQVVRAYPVLPVLSVPITVQTEPHVKEESYV